MDFGVYFLYDFTDKFNVDAIADDNDDYDYYNGDGENTDRLIFAL